MVHGVAPGDRGDALAGLPPLPGLALLVRRELGLAPHLPTLGLGAGSPFARAGADQFPLELRQARQHREHEPPVRARRIGPGVAQGAEGRTLLGQGAQHVEEVARGAREPVQARHQHHVAGAHLLEEPRELRPVALGPRGGFAEHLARASGLEALHLRRERLAVGAHPRIAQGAGQGGRGGVMLCTGHMHRLSC